MFPQEKVTREAKAQSKEKKMAKITIIQTKQPNHTCFAGRRGSLGINVTDKTRVFFGNGTETDMKGSKVTDTYYRENNYIFICTH